MVEMVWKGFGVRLEDGRYRPQFIFLETQK
jgi:hypothetical protein